MFTRKAPRIAYIMKMYPRFSETFIVNEILSHQKAGVNVDIFSLRKPVDGRFHEMLSSIQSAVTYIPENPLSGEKLWKLIQKGTLHYPQQWNTLQESQYSNANEISQAFMLADIIRDRKITHLHAHFATTATTVARLAALMTGISYTFTAHAKDIFHSSVVESDFSNKLEYAQAAITISDFNYTYIKQHYGESASRLQRVYNGLFLNEFVYEQPKKISKTIISVSRLVTKKGISFLIDACFRLRKKGVDFQCLIIGDGPLKEQLQNEISTKNLDEFVILLGEKTQMEVKQLVKNSAVFAAPCIIAEDGNRDGLPTVLLEAMALGTPCISTNVTGIPEVIKDHVTGLLISEKNSLQLSNAIERLLNDDNLGMTLSKNARKLIEKEFDIDKNTKILRCIMNNQYAIEKNNTTKKNQPEVYCA
ncbi:MAG: glycosyltransferase family 4 protein [Gammaproteobacteria bacterium]|nr:glycosyltransferase family 4 protein [Gammaproteobacteria bacterium]